MLLANAALEKLQSLEAVAAEDATWVAAKTALTRVADTGVDEARIALVKIEANIEAEDAGEARAIRRSLRESSLGVSKNKDGTYNTKAKPDRDAAHVWFELPIARSALARAQARVAYETEADGIKIDKTIIK